MKKQANRPRVVLCGRPNVGKSTLFNRLLRARRAITEPTPGVTRDAVAADCHLLGKPVTLIDTGGFRLESAAEPDSIEGELEERVRERTLETLKSADLIVLVLEAALLTGEDEEFIALLRPYSKKVIAAVNKTEGGRHVEEAWNLARFGFEHILMISAEHGDNIGQLEEAIVGALDFTHIKEENAIPAPSETARTIRLVIAGKPNTGKSTLSNRLTASTASLVSDLAGTTRDTIEGSFDWKGTHFVVVDTAGQRKKARVAESIEYYSVNRAVKAMENCDIVVILIDATEGFAEQDKKIAAIANEAGRGVIFALNKWDLMPDIKNAANAAADKIRYFFGQMDYAPIIPLSARTGEGVDKLLRAAVSMYRELTTTIDTAVFNRSLEKWLAENPPPYGPQTRFKIRYGLQTSANPVRFALFVSRPQAVKEAYAAYLRNKIRTDLRFTTIPIALELRRSGRERPPAQRGRAKGGAV